MAESKPAPTGVFDYEIAVRRRLPDGSMEQRMYGLTEIQPDNLAQASGDAHMLLADMEYQANQGTPQTRTKVNVWLGEGGGLTANPVMRAR